MLLPRFAYNMLIFSHALILPLYTHFSCFYIFVVPFNSHTLFLHLPLAMEYLGLLPLPLFAVTIYGERFHAHRMFICRMAGRPD